MSNVKIVQLLDENKNPISPKVATGSIIASDGELLENYLEDFVRFKSPEEGTDTYIEPLYKSINYSELTTSDKTIIGAINGLYAFDKDIATIKKLRVRQLAKSNFTNLGNNLYTYYFASTHPGATFLGAFANSTTSHTQQVVSFRANEIRVQADNANQDFIVLMFYFDPS